MKNEADFEQAVQLVAILGNLPVIIGLAASMLKQTGMPCAQFREQFEQAKAMYGHLKVHHEDDSQQADVVVLMALTLMAFREISRWWPMASELVRLASYLHGEGIAFSLLEELLERFQCPDTTAEVNSSSRENKQEQKEEAKVTHEEVSGLLLLLLLLLLSLLVLLVLLLFWCCCCCCWRW